LPVSINKAAKRFCQTGGANYSFAASYGAVLLYP
jgi:hypothetical protein